jgi:hypothetical protein
MKEKVNEFVDRFPDFHALAPSDQVLRLIYFHAVVNGRESINTPELKHLFGLAGLRTPKNLPKLLAYLCGRGAKLISSKGEFSLRREVQKSIEEELGTAQASVLFIDPTQAFKATLSLHDFLSKLRGSARVCDAYLDNTTLEHLYALDKAVPVRLLTKNVKDSGTLRRLAAAWKSEGRILEIRVDNSAPLHDRYIIDDASMVILGTSLNGFGKKQCFIIQAGPDMRAVLIPVFDGLWNSATAWP